MISCQARLWHPDKNASEDAQLKFQAISWAYEYLRNPTNRADYDETGTLPQEDQETNDEGVAQWKSYFDELFGRVDIKAIDEFALKYKMSTEEENDVLRYYERFKGDLTKMLEHVMLSEERDCLRWIEDYIKPAVESGKVTDYMEKASKILKRIRNKLEKAAAKVGADETDKDVTGDCTDGAPNKRKVQVVEGKKQVPARAKSTKPKRGFEEDALVAAIRARAATRNPFAALGARYGVAMEGDDPLDDKEFAVLQKKTKRKKK